MSEKVVVLIPLEKLCYDFDSDVGRNWPEFISAFKVLEKTLPDIPTRLQFFVHNYYIKLPEVYRSIADEGLKKPLQVSPVGKYYRVRVGNQRLLSIRSQKKLKEVPCIILKGDKCF